METPSRSRRSRWAFPRRIGLRSLLALVAACAIGLGVRDAYSPVRSWKRAIRDPNATLRYGAMFEAVVGRNPAIDRAAAFAEVVEALRDPDPDTRAAAAAVLTEVGPAPVAALPELIRATGDRSLAVRLGAYNSLSWNSIPGTSGRDEAIVALTRGMADPQVRAIAATGMLRCGRNDGVLPVVMGFLRGDVAGFRTRGITLLRDLETPDAEVRSALLAATRRRDDADPSRQSYYLSRSNYARYAAAILLARFGEAGEILPILREAEAVADNRDTSFRQEVGLALRAVGAPTLSP